jgi:hypothetical protein
MKYLYAILLRPLLWLVYIQLLVLLFGCAFLVRLTWDLNPVKAHQFADEFCGKQAQAAQKDGVEEVSALCFILLLVFLAICIGNIYL